MNNQPQNTASCKNFFENITVPDIGEQFDTLLDHPTVEIKRIVSSADIDEEIMIQEEDEWFILLKGAARMRIKEKELVLKSGDYCFVGAKQVHQILSVETGSIWLAVHIK